jgi:Fe-Mn family superoxide dismutase
MRTYKTWLPIAAIVLVLLIFGIVLTLRFKKSMVATGQTDAYVSQSPKTYSIKPYAQLIGHIKGLTEKQLSQHYDLYVGYVKKRNQIEHDLQTVDRTNAAGITYSPFRSLKTAETFAVNGSLLHELYFENMSAQVTQPGPETMNLIMRSFGSLDNFKKDLIDSAGVARGWAVMMYGMDDGHVHNYVFESHNQNIPVLSIPLLVLDVYEHAYMIDFGIKRAAYLDVFWENVNWDIVEQRIKKWVLPLQHAARDTKGTKNIPVS